MYIGSQFVDDYANMSQGGFQIPIGMAWASYMKATKFWPWEVNTCPVSLGFGPDLPTAITRAMTERYNYIPTDAMTGYPNFVFAIHSANCTNEGADYPLP
jgi:hypothetical protein